MKSDPKNSATVPVEARGVSRRELLGAGAAFGIPAIVPASALANPRRGRLGANDRIVVGNIGVGGMGSTHIRPDSAALCDVDDRQLAKAAKRVTQGAPTLYKDFRKLLERKDIDAVTIATPDHWHAIMCVMACQAGKHVYSEKPTCKSIEEGRAMVNAARHNSRVVQIGMQGRSNPAVAAAANYVRNGMIGPVERVEIWHPVNPTAREWYAPEPVPAGLDWEMWLGPARWSEYHHLKHPANFRWFWDYGEGNIRDRGNHAMNVVSWLTANDEYRGRVSCVATGTPTLEGIWDVPATMRVEWTFEQAGKPAWTLVWEQPGTPNPRMKGLWGATYEGTKGDLVVIQGDSHAATEEKALSYMPPSGGFHAYLEPFETDDVTERHRQNWFSSIRANRRPASDVEIGVHVVTLPIVGNIAYRLGRKVTYEYAVERFIADEEANRLLSIPYRAPWKL